MQQCPGQTGSGDSGLPPAEVVSRSAERRHGPPEQVRLQLIGRRSVPKNSSKNNEKVLIVSGYF